MDGPDEKAVRAGLGALRKGQSRFSLPRASGICCRLHRFRKLLPLSLWIEIVGALAALITTFAWLPQIQKIRRERSARDISIVTTGTLASGVFLWVLYGMAIGSLPVILANSVSLLFILTIVGLKLRYG